MDQGQFRGISLSEYNRRRDDTATRITTEDLEPGLIVEAFSTNQFLTKQNMAVTFTAEVNFLQKHRPHDMGRTGFQLIVLSGILIARQPIDRFTIGVPQDHVHDTAPLIWTINNPLRLLQFAPINTGFFSQWADSDTSGLDYYTNTNAPPDNHP